jgi:hyperosmotically inducible protein
MEMDEKIKKDVVDQLFWDGRVDASAIQVTVKDGEVTLSGDVDSFAARQAAENDVLSIPGVQAIQNRLAVKYPSMVPIPSDDEIKRNIESVLKWNPYIDDSQIDVAVNNGIVNLKGTVESRWKSDKIELIAYDILGVVEVANQLSIVPTEDLGDKVIAEEMAAALARKVDVDPDDIEIKVENGNVVLSGSVSNWNAFRSAYETALHTPGVISVINKLSLKKT